LPAGAMHQLPLGRVVPHASHSLSLLALLDCLSPSPASGTLAAHWTNQPPLRSPVAVPALDERNSCLPCQPLANIRRPRIPIAPLPISHVISSHSCPQDPRNAAEQILYLGFDGVAKPFSWAVEELLDRRPRRRLDKRTDVYPR